MSESRNVAPFNRDAADRGGYQYTRTTLLSNQMATQRTTDAILEAGQFAGRSILDVGCGDSFFTRRFWDQGGPRKMMGIDMAVKAIKVAIANRDNRPIIFGVGDAHHLPYANNAFDMVLIQSILHHDDDPPGIIQEAFRVAPKILIHEPNGNNPALKLIEKVSPYHREHGERSYSLPKMRMWIEQAGGKLTSCQFAGFVAMFSPDWLAKIMRGLEPTVERLPVLRYWGCAVYVMTASRM